MIEVDAHGWTNMITQAIKPRLSFMVVRDMCLLPELAKCIINRYLLSMMALYITF